MAGPVVTSSLLDQLLDRAEAGHPVHLLVDLPVDELEAPMKDCARPHGFYLDPALVPPDDEAQDALCAVRAAIANAAARLSDTAVHPPAVSAPGAARPTVAPVENAGAVAPRPGSVSAEPPARATSMWDGARI